LIICDLLEFSDRTRDWIVWNIIGVHFNDGELLALVPASNMMRFSWYPAYRWNNPAGQPWNACDQKLCQYSKTRWPVFSCTRECAGKFQRGSWKSMQVSVMLFVNGSLITFVF